LSGRDQHAIEEMCRPMLVAFGYDAPPSRLRARAHAVAVRARDLSVSGLAELRARLAPARREF
jgi:hypothetical protein